MYEQERSFRHNEKLFSNASGVPRRQLENCRIVADRNDLLQLIPKGGIAAVLGLAHGDRVRQILDLTEPAELHVFRFEFDPDDDIGRFGAAIAARRLIFHDCPGLEPDVERIDWAYIENEVTTDAVNFHIERALPILRKDGILVFNGYPSHAGVVGAVNDLAVNQACAFLAYAVSSNDVALRVADGGEP
jgi:hypothetical protein